ncbi:MAG: hypothetical protein QXF76_00035 [Candidatus Anstonellales archaeon]
MKRSLNNNLNKDLELILETFNRRENYQNICTNLMWDIIRVSAKIVNNLLAKKDTNLNYDLEFKEIEEKLKTLRQKINEIEWYQNILILAEQEYCEAYLFYNYLKNKKIITFSDMPVKISCDSYFYGLCDFTGELKRHALNCLLINDSREAEEAINLMEEIYYQVSIFKFSESVVPDLRRKIDTLRINLDHAKSELFMFKMRSSKD